MLNACSGADKVSAFKRGKLVLVLLGNESPINKLDEFLEEVSDYDTTALYCCTALRLGR